MTAVAAEVPEEKTVQMLINVPESLRRQIKILAALTGTTMGDIEETAMRLGLEALKGRTEKETGISITGF
jgi:hypothetical protein